MGRFTELGKKKMLGELTKEEAAELDQLLQNKPELKQLYDMMFAKPEENTEKDHLEAEKAYAVHFVKMHLKNKLDP
jgi:hypothetical protein